MSPYLPALTVATAALLVLVVLVVRAVVLVRRFAALAGAYRRQLIAESALLEHRRSELLAKLARHSDRRWRRWRHTRTGTPRIIRQRNNRGASWEVWERPKSSSSPW